MPAFSQNDVVPLTPRPDTAPAMPLLTPLPARSAYRTRITAAWRQPEPTLVPALTEAAQLTPALAQRRDALALRLVKGLRERGPAGGKSGLVQGLLQQFSLSSQEGIALMCLAEALLRIPDAHTRDALIRDKVRDGHWQEHLGQSPSLFVNAAAWGLMLTGRLVATHSESGLSGGLARLIARGGEPLIRKGVDVAMRMMGEQFVAGETIAKALRHARGWEAKGFRYSYDMLGEAALTAADAQRYRQDYEQAIHAIGAAAAGQGVYAGPGISIKLSALHPRYGRAQIERVHDELYPILRDLAQLARHYDIGLNIDAEEADRLELSLDLLERLCHDPALAGWQGIGFVIQAYQKRCPEVIDYLIDLAARSHRRLMIRLVKGAYWDSEIKRTQVEGLPDYPVYTRKPYTDIAYIACARKLLAAPEQIYPQFATHNAQTLATLYELAGPDTYHPGQYEFQCLHGMGEPLYEQVVGPAPAALARPCRIYAPVGSHETLLAYLVRRLLENGANTSFVNRVADPSIPLQALVQDPVQQVQLWARQEGRLGLPHPGIASPAGLYGAVRANSQGRDLADESVLATLSATPREAVAGLAAGDTGLAGTDGEVQIARNPAEHSDVLGGWRPASRADVEAALATAAGFAPVWAATPPAVRAQALLRAADRMQAQMNPLVVLLAREAGKTCANAVAEVREAVDFLRYYAAQVQDRFDNATHIPLGPVVCISPWNFPLAIFTGQVAAALAAGNTVLAKPAEQTTLVATAAVALLHEAGVPGEAVQLVRGRGVEVGPWLTGDARVQGVMFTGSTEVARALQRTLATRLTHDGQPVPLVAETGGQNAMIVDSSALAEQVVQDVILSAFDSAGQRCSALRVLCVQEDVADRLLTMLAGAMRELRLGAPTELRNDVGPVIDARARDTINAHVAAMLAKGCPVRQLAWGEAADHADVMARGTYVLPTLIEIASLADLKREVFGPVLHVLRYRREALADLLAQIAATGYGLTLGVHSRIDETIAQVTTRAHVGNLYVNRNMVGAVVGVQPFGGEGLSGTGPKAGGPLYLYRLLARRPDTVLSQPFGVLRELPGQPFASDVGAAHAALRQWAAQRGVALGPAMRDAAGQARYELAGPTGERNVYGWQPRGAVLCVADTDADLCVQLDAVLCVGATAVLVADSVVARALHDALPAAVRARVRLTAPSDPAPLGAALVTGNAAQVLEALRCLAQRDGAIVPLIRLSPGAHVVPLERLLHERAISTNTAAAGGNASLMTLAD